jgi:hypothetical protein
MEIKYLCIYLRPVIAVMLLFYSFDCKKDDINDPDGVLKDLVLKDSVIRFGELIDSPSVSYLKIGSLANQNITIQHRLDTNWIDTENKRKNETWKYVPTKWDDSSYIQIKYY